MNTLNTFELAGKVIGQPTTLQTSNGKEFVKFWLDIPKLVQGAEQSVYYELTCFNDDLVHTAKNLHAGKEILCKGRVNSNGYKDKNGQQRLATSLLVNNIYEEPTTANNQQIPPVDMTGITDENLPF